MAGKQSPGLPHNALLAIIDKPQCFTWFLIPWPYAVLRYWWDPKMIYA